MQHSEDSVTRNLRCKAPRFQGLETAAQHDFMNLVESLGGQRTLVSDRRRGPPSCSVKPSGPGRLATCGVRLDNFERVER
jgi:hypothetical protein